MSTTNTGGPAFPRMYPRSDEDGTTGMDLRDWFAGQALPQVMRDYCESDVKHAEKCAELSYLFADAMIRWRNKDTP